MRQMLAVLRNRNLGLLLSARFISTTAMWLYAVAMAIAIYKYSHGSSFLVGLFWIVRLIPNLVLGPVMGALADRSGPKGAMIVSNLARMVILAALGLALTSSTWPIIFPTAFLVNAFLAMFRPASVAIIPPLVKNPDERLHANAAVMQVDAISMILGSALAGTAAALGVINPILFVTALAFGMSAGLVWLIRLQAPVPAGAVEAAEGGTEGAEEFGEGMIAGFRLIRSRPLLIFAAAVMALPEFASGANVVWIVPYAEKHIGSAGVGYLYTAMGAGLLLGGLVASLIASNFRLDQLLTGSVLVCGAALVLWGLTPVAIGAVFALAIVGIAETVEYAAYETLLQQAAPENILGRAVGTMESFFFNLMLVGNVASGVLASVFGVTWSIAGLGILIVAGTVAAWWYLQARTANQPDALTLAKIPAFAAVPMPIREWAIVRMAREQFSPGQTVIRQGDEGDKFYAIARGRARVDVAGTDQQATVAELGPGDYFGEIALLHDVPRTATVEAIRPLTLWSLSREDFQELQERAAEFKESILDTAAVRMAQSANVGTGLASRAT